MLNAYQLINLLLLCIASISLEERINMYVVDQIILTEGGTAEKRTRPAKKMDLLSASLVAEDAKELRETFYLLIGIIGDESFTE